MNTELQDQPQAEPIPQSDIRRASYELFVYALSIIAMLNSTLLALKYVNVLNVDVLRVINFVLALFFLVDFFLRLARGRHSRSHYFVRGFGWADLLSSVPYWPFQFFRIFRIVSSTILLRQFGGRSLLKEVRRNQAGGALYLALFLAVLLIEIASTSIINIEASNPQANIKTASDAIWWAYVTVTTVGYGDYYPVTNPGRVLGVLVMSVGVGLFGVFSGFLANAFLGNSRANEKQAVAATATVAATAVDNAPVTGNPYVMQSAELQALLTQQEENFAALRRHLEAMDAELQAAGITVPATTPSDTAPPE